MNCCQGIEDTFSEPYVSWELSRYRKNGPNKTTQIMVEELEKEGVQGLTLLDVGGGVGAVHHALLEAGVQTAVDVDASRAYLKAAREEAQRRGVAEKTTFLHGNFVELAPDIPPADIVTLDRVVCCYPDMQQLVNLSAARARRLYALVFPRYVGWIKLGLAVLNFIYRLQRRPFRIFAHSTQTIEAIANHYGLHRRSFRRTLIWQVIVYSHE